LFRHSHNTNDTWTLLSEIGYMNDTGDTVYLRLTPEHQMWGLQTADDKNGQVVDGKLDVSFARMVGAEEVQVGDFVVTANAAGTQLNYRKVTVARTDMFQGFSNNQFSSAGLFFVDGVLATTSASNDRNHWSKVWVNAANMRDFMPIPADLVGAEYANPDAAARANAMFDKQKSFRTFDKQQVASGKNFDDQCFHDQLKAMSAGTDPYSGLLSGNITITVNMPAYAGCWKA